MAVTGRAHCQRQVAFFFWNLPIFGNFEKNKGQGLTSLNSKTLFWRETLVHMIVSFVNADSKFIFHLFILGIDKMKAGFEKPALKIH